jgi:hypothetical protein
LLSKGADVNAQDDQGVTSLMRAVSNGHAGIVRELLGNGADVHAKDNKGETSLMKAEAKSYSEIRSMLRIMKNAKSFSVREKILLHAICGWKTSIKDFGSDQRKFNVFYKFWLEYLRYIKDKDVIHMVCGFRSVSSGKFILIEVFSDDANALFYRYGEDGILQQIERRVLSDDEIELKRSGCSAYGNYVLPGCRYVGTLANSSYGNCDIDWTQLILAVEAGQYIVVNPE